MQFQLKNHCFQSEYFSQKASSRKVSEMNFNKCFLESFEKKAFRKSCKNKFSRFVFCQVYFYKDLISRVEKLRKKEA